MPPRPVSPRRRELVIERVCLGLSQHAVAEKIGIDRRTYARAEKLGDGVDLTTALKIAAFYERPLVELFPDLVERAA